MGDLNAEANRVEAELLVRNFVRPTEVPKAPGIYALWACGPESISDLDVGDVDVSSPLYIGKAQDSLRTRLEGTHFKKGKTGWSTVRRTFAALLSLRACPRPSRIVDPTPKQVAVMCTNFGILAEDEERLTRWMTENVMVTSAACYWTPLKELEDEIARRVKPPLNIEGATWPTPCRRRLDDARKEMRQAARAAFIGP